MENKLILLLMYILIPCTLCCQERDFIEDRVFYDKTNGMSVFKTFKHDEKIIIEYYTLKDTIRLIDVNIDFVGGIKELYRCCDSLYYTNFTKESFCEVNARVPYVIFFDNKLKIREVHVLQEPSLYNYNEKYDYDSLIKRILISTEGKWQKKNQISDWYIYIGLFHLK